jgi:hypothetical protein
MPPIRYGVFKLGQIWTVTDDRGARLGFPSREIALAAVTAIVAVHQAALQPVLVTVQDERGALRTILNPLDVERLEVANDDSWDLLLGTEALMARRPNPAAASGRTSASKLAAAPDIVGHERAAAVEPGHWRSEARHGL